MDMEPQEFETDPVIIQQNIELEEQIRQYGFLDTTDLTSDEIRECITIAKQTFVRDYGFNPSRLSYKIGYKLTTWTLATISAVTVFPVLLIFTGSLKTGFIGFITAPTCTFFFRGFKFKQLEEKFKQYVIAAVRMKVESQQSSHDSTFDHYD